MSINSKTPLVSIIVPIYQVEQYLDKCITSIMNQTYANLEIILIDDGSKDQSGKICDSYAEKDERVIVIHKENSGLALTRQVGFETAHGAYVMVVDGDDWIDEETIQVCLGVATSENAECVLFSYVKEYEDNSIPVHLFNKNQYLNKEIAANFVHRRIIGVETEEMNHPEQIDSFSSVCMKLYRADILKKGRIISERLVGTSEDTVFNMYALEGCKRVECIDKCFYHYRKTNSNSITMKYKPDLAEKWDFLYQVFEEFFLETNSKQRFENEFLNRIACGMIGLGLNEVNAKKNVFKKAKSIKKILNRPLYRKAFRHLDITYCPLKWKLFFGLCKYKLSFILTVLLEVMNHLRRVMAG